MDAYQVGKLFPHEEYCTGREMNVAIPTEGFFHILMALKKISRRVEKESCLQEVQSPRHSLNSVIFLFWSWISERISVLISLLISQNLMMKPAESGWHQKQMQLQSFLWKQQQVYLKASASLA